MQLWKFRRKIHTSWLIAVFSLAMVVGVFAVQFVPQTIFAPVAWLAVALVCMGWALWRRAAYVLPVVVLAGSLLGLWRGSVLATQVEVYAHVMGRTAEVRGKVVEDTDVGSAGEVNMRLGSIAINGHEVAGRVWVNLAGKQDIKRGDIVTVKGKVSEGFGNYAASMYRTKLVDWQRPNPGDVARRVRDWFADKIRLAIHEPQASLGLGYLLGQKRALPPELQDALVVTGLTHVVVASGYNLTILVRLARRLFARVSKYLSTLSATTMILGFMAITGASPSMARAGLVSGLSLAAWYYGRKFHPLVLLPFAAAVTVMIDPSYAWNDLGWELSFAAFAGVMILAPLLQRYFYGNAEPGTVRQILGETISAQVMTLPILVMAFGAMSNVAIIANLLVLPLVPLAMLLTFVAGVAVLVAPWSAAWVGQPAEWVLTYVTSVIAYFANLPWAQVEVQIGVWQVVAAYVVIVVACVYMWRATGYSLRGENVVK